MRVEEIRQEINQLDMSDKILLIADVWDSIAQSNGELPMPEWQKGELDLRYKSYKAGKQNLHDWGAVHESLRKKYS
ncbi:MAG: addiction module protein [Desulfococcaceae bacterium]|jgi:putative addiction module component (TIGR02574 family)|nr:addiction module protein [Desulfococcaceae bacterium]